MSKKWLFLLPLLCGAPLFLTGALRRPPADLPPASFIPQPVTLAPQLRAAGLDAGSLLDRVLAHLAPERVAWLHVQLWQRLNDAEYPFESEGTLQLGPNHCARLDIAVCARGIPGRWLVVSDGNAIAHVTQSGSEPPAVTSRLLIPGTSGADGPAPRPPAEALCDLGCGGPYPLLKDLRGKMADLSAQTGLCQGRPVVRVRGRLNRAVAGTPQTAAFDFCYLYLDAQTLWPGRLEWWGRGAAATPRPLLEIEFRAPQVNQPLSVSECIRVFSYRPEPGT